MIGGSAEERTQQPFATGPASFFLIGGLQGDKHRINFGQDPGIGDGQHPALLRLLILGEWA